MGTDHSVRANLHLEVGALDLSDAHLGSVGGASAAIHGLLFRADEATHHQPPTGEEEENDDSANDVLHGVGRGKLRANLLPILMKLL